MEIIWWAVDNRFGEASSGGGRSAGDLTVLAPLQIVQNVLITQTPTTLKSYCVAVPAASFATHIFLTTTPVVNTAYHFGNCIRRRI